MVNITLLAHVSRTIDARRAAAESSATVKRLRDEFNAEHAALIARAASDKATVDAAETALDAVVHAHYKIHFDRKPVPGVEVKEFETMEYDAAKAFEWAKKTGMALNPESLNAEAFAQIASAAPLSVPFVKFGSQPRVQFAKDMEKAIAVAQATDPSVAEALAQRETAAAVE